MEFSIVGMLRFISHLELQRFFARLALRAGLPVHFSQGFNPRARISLPVPRSVGIGSWDDRARIELEEPVEAQEAIVRMNGLVPFEMKIDRAWMTDSGQLERVQAIEWQIDVSGVDPQEMSRRIEDLKTKPCVKVRRSKKTGRETTLDFQSLILELELQDHRVRAKIAYNPQGSIRPAELMELLLSGFPKEECIGRMTRTKTYWIR